MFLCILAFYSHLRSIVTSISPTDMSSILASMDPPQGVVIVRKCKGSFCSISYGWCSELPHVETASCYEPLQQRTKTAQMCSESVKFGKGEQRLLYLALLSFCGHNSSKVKEPVFVPGTSCCTTISFSHFSHENLLFIVGFSNTKGYLTIGVCLVAPKSDCLTQVWVKQAPFVTSAIHWCALLLLSRI